jgi:predicted metal-dependent hydrolase
VSATDAPDQLALFGAEAAVVVRRSARARRLSLRVFPHGLVEVVAPPRAAERSIHRFVSDHQGWIQRARREFGASPQARMVDPPGEIGLAAVGEVWTVAYAEGARRLRSVPGADGGSIRLTGPVDPVWRVQQLRRWLQQRGRAVLEPWLAQVASETGLAYRGVTVRRQRSRWGSCSARHDISLNCALLFLEPALVRHVLVHELAHTRHLNHGPAFWRLVARLAPDFELAERELRAAWRSVPAWVNHDPM